jgi:hypothetical protein
MIHKFETLSMKACRFQRTSDGRLSFPDSQNYLAMAARNLLISLRISDQHELPVIFKFYSGGMVVHRHIRHNF